MFKPFHLQCFTFTDIVNSHSQPTPQSLTPYSHGRIFPEEKHQESPQDIRGDIQTSNNKSFQMNTPVKLRANHGNISVRMSSEDNMSAFLNKNSAEHLHKNFSPFYSPSCFQQIPQRQVKISGDSDKSEIAALSCGTDRGEEEKNTINNSLKTHTVKHFLDVQGEILRQKLQKAQEDIDSRQLKAEREGQGLVSLIGSLKKQLENQNDANMCRREIEDSEQEKQGGNTDKHISLGIRNRSWDRKSAKSNYTSNINSDSGSVHSRSLMNSEQHHENISADLMEELNRSFSSLDSVKSKNKLAYQQIYITRSLQINNALNRFTSDDPLQNSKFQTTFLKIYSQPRKQSLIHKQITRLSRHLGEIQTKQIIQDRAIQHALFLFPSAFSNNKTDLINKMFQCKFCFKSFPKSCSLGGHISRVHKGKSDPKKPQLTRQKGKKQQNESPLCRPQHNTSSSNSPTEKKKQRKDEEFFAQSKQVTKKISKSQSKRKQEEQASSRQLGNLKKALFSNNNLFAEQIPLL